MDKEAQEALENAREMLGNAASGAGDKISDFMESAGPALERYKGPALTALIGAILGGGASALSGGDPISGATLGGVAGGAGRLGYDFLSGHNILPGEDPGGPLVGGAINLAADPLSDNLGLAAGTGAGAVAARKHFPIDHNFRNYISGAKGKLDLGGQKMKPRKALDALKRGRPGTKEGLKRLAEQVAGRGASGMPSRWAFAAPAVGGALGFVLDRYLQGEY